MSSRMKATSRMLALVGVSIAGTYCGGGSKNIVDPPMPSPIPTPTPTPVPLAADCAGPYGPIQAGRSITFSGVNSTTPNPPLAYSWDPGDNAGPLTGVTPTHTYQKCKQGTKGCFVGKKFKVTLTVTDAASKTATCETTCEVSNLY
jgi:hypothetical protein